MSNDSGATGEIALNTRPEVIEKLRRLKQLQKDSKGEYYETTFGGDTSRTGMSTKPLKFYVGHAIRLPLDWVKALTGFGGDGSHGSGRIIEAEEVCGQCKGKGSIPTGLCFHCKGAKWIKTGQFYHMFRLISQDDPTNFDVNDAPMRKLDEKVDEAATALA